MRTLIGISVDPLPRMVCRRLVRLEGTVGTPGTHYYDDAPAKALSYKEIFFNKMWLSFLTKICSVLDVIFCDDAIKLGANAGEFSSFDNCNVTTCECF